MENARILCHLAVVLVDSFSLVVFGIAAFTMLCGAAFTMLLMSANANLGVTAWYFAIVIWMWTVFSCWFIYTARYRRDEVQGYWLPAFWLAAWGTLTPVLRQAPW